MTRTAWGEATVAEEIVIDQGDFQALVQLLENNGGERLVRFAYATGGQARRGPVTLRQKDLAKLGKALANKARLREALAVCRAPPRR